MDERLPGLRTSSLLDDATARYGLLQLVHHLAAAGRAGDLNRLLALEWPTHATPTTPARTDNTWYLVHDEAGETTAYLSDVRLARQLAEATTDQALTQGRQTSSIALEIRYGLISASIISIARNIPAPLLAAVVDKQLWTPAHALAYAREAPASATKSEVLTVLALHLPEAERSAVLAEALAAARTIPQPYEQVEALAALAPHLPEAERPAVLAEALAAAHTHEPWGQGPVLAGLTPHLPAELLPEALADARTIPESSGRARALAGLAPHLPEAERPAVLAEALAAAHKITEPFGWEQRIPAIVEASRSMGFLAWTPYWRAAFAGAGIRGRECRCYPCCCC
jgi:hypothetical protein